MGQNTTLTRQGKNRRSLFRVQEIFKRCSIPDDVEEFLGETIRQANSSGVYVLVMEFDQGHSFHYCAKHGLKKCHAQGKSQFRNDHKQITGRNSPRKWEAVKPRRNVFSGTKWTYIKIPKQFLQGLSTVPRRLVWDSFITQVLTRAFHFGSFLPSFVTPL